MNYKGKSVGITGSTGFIGSALMVALNNAGAGIRLIDGDIRDAYTFKEIDYSFDYLFHFAAPSSQVLFKQQPEYCTDVTINGFLNAKRACEKNGVKLIYPSTGLLSSGDSNEYARCKAICESIAPKDALGLRIFATYGPGEGHKRDYASVPYLFARDMVAGKSPIVFGDGEQTRDIVYIDDVINGIMVMAEESNLPIVELGSGEQISFNQIIDEINNHIGSDIEPILIDTPDKYVFKTQSTKLYNNWQPKVSSTEGIKLLLESLK